MHDQATDDENHQGPSTDEDDVPEMPPEPPELPDGTVKRQDEPPSTELKGEWKILGSCEVGRTSSHADVTGVSEGDVDPRNRPNAVWNASARERECSEERSPEDSPEGGRDDRGNPSGEAHASRASARIEDVRKRPKMLWNMSKRIRKRSERKGEESSPGRP